jgi:adhesin/invasin
VTLTSSRGATDIITQPSTPTNASGQTTGTVRSTTGGTAVISANDTTDAVAVIQTASVTFTAGGLAHFRVSASPTTLTAGNATTITITAHDASHNVVTAYSNPNGLNLTQNGTGSAGQITWGGTGVTDGGTTATLAAGNFSNGVATVTLTDQQAEGPVTITVTDAVAGTTGNTNDAAHAPTTNVTWNVGPVAAAVSTVTASPATVTADGVATSTITVTLLDLFGNPVSGKSVGLTSSRGIADTITQPAVVTNAARSDDGHGALDGGRGERDHRDRHHGWRDRDADRHGHVRRQQRLGGHVTVSANPSTVLADGVATSAITVTLRDASRNPVRQDRYPASSRARPIRLCNPQRPRMRSDARPAA